jgi:hypothetical protein
MKIREMTPIADIRGTVERALADAFTADRAPLTTTRPCATTSGPIRSRS